jgi:hypothetical protein
LIIVFALGPKLAALVQRPVYLACAKTVTKAGLRPFDFGAVPHGQAEMAPSATELRHRINGFETWQE